MTDDIAPSEPIPYKIPGQGAVYLNEGEHGIVYAQVMELIAEVNK